MIKNKKNIIISMIIIALFSFLSSTSAIKAVGVMIDDGTSAVAESSGKRAGTFSYSGGYGKVTINNKTSYISKLKVGTSIALCVEQKKDVTRAKGKTYTNLSTTVNSSYAKVYNWLLGAPGSRYKAAQIAVWALAATNFNWTKAKVIFLDEIGTIDSKTAENYWTGMLNASSDASNLAIWGALNGSNTQKVITYKYAGSPYTGSSSGNSGSGSSSGSDSDSDDEKTAAIYPACGLTGEVSDPADEDIVNNEAYTTSINAYCSVICREDVTIVTPSNEENGTNVFKAGSYFTIGNNSMENNYSDLKIIGTKTCRMVHLSGETIIDGVDITKFKDNLSVANKRVESDNATVQTAYTAMQTALAQLEAAKANQDTEKCEALEAEYSNCVKSTNSKYNSCLKETFTTTKSACTGKFTATYKCYCSKTSTTSTTMTEKQCNILIHSNESCKYSNGKCVCTSTSMTANNYSQKQCNLMEPLGCTYKSTGVGTCSYTAAQCKAKYNTTTACAKYQSEACTNMNTDFNDNYQDRYDEAVDAYNKALTAYNADLLEVIGLVQKLKDCSSMETVTYDFEPKLTIEYPVGLANTNNISYDYSGSLASTVTTEVEDNTTSGGEEIGSYAAGVDEKGNVSYQTYTVANVSSTGKKSYTITTTYDYYLSSSQGWNYVNKLDGASTKNLSSYNKTNQTYYYIGPHIPLSIGMVPGTYYFNIKISNLGEYDAKFGSHFSEKFDFSCEVIVESETKEKCDSTTSSSECCDSDDDLYPYCKKDAIGEGGTLIYRPIELGSATIAFPYINGNGRNPGANWSRTYSFSTNPVADFITYNRGVTGDEVYDLKPIYSITLTPSLIREIKAYNDAEADKGGYGDFNLTCVKGNRCISSFIHSTFNSYFSGTCSKVNSSTTGSFYSCADKPNEDI